MEAECSKQCGGGYTTLTRKVISGHNCDARQDTVGIDGYISGKIFTTSRQVRTEHCNEAPCPGSVATTAAVPVAVCLMVGLALAVVCCCLYR